jgi:hypothetical protein
VEEALKMFGPPVYVCIRQNPVEIDQPTVENQVFGLPAFLSESRAG